MRGSNVDDGVADLQKKDPYMKQSLKIVRHSPKHDYLKINEVVNLLRLGCTLKIP